MLHPLSVSTIGLCMKQHLGKPQHRQSTKLFYCCLQLSNIKSNMIATGCKKSFHHPVARNKKMSIHAFVLELLGTSMLTRHFIALGQKKWAPFQAVLWATAVATTLSWANGSPHVFLNGSISLVIVCSVTTFDKTSKVWKSNQITGVFPQFLGDIFHTINGIPNFYTSF